MDEATAIRAVRYRALPGTRAKARGMNRIAGACRHVWNCSLDRQNAAYLGWQFSSAGRPPFPTFFTLGKAFTQLRGSKAHAWLKELPFAPVRYVLKRQADAWQRFLSGQGGKPRFKGRGYGMGFTLPDSVRIRNGRIHIPKLGPRPAAAPRRQPASRRRSEAGRVHSGGREVVLHRLLRDRRSDSPGAGRGDRRGSQRGAVRPKHGRTHPHARHGASGSPPPPIPPAHGAAVKGQRTAPADPGEVRSDVPPRPGHPLELVPPNQPPHRRCGGGGGHRGPRREANDAFGQGNSGGARLKRSGAKAGLNRAILASGWGGLERNLAYKAGRLLKVRAAYTSQRCFACGAVASANRPDQSTFRCQACGHAANADVNAAENIRRLGMAQLDGEGRLAPEACPTIRQRGGGTLRAA